MPILKPVLNVVQTCFYYDHAYRILCVLRKRLQVGIQNGDILYCPQLASPVQSKWETLMYQASGVSDSTENVPSITRELPAVFPKTRTGSTRQALTRPNSIKWCMSEAQVTVNDSLYCIFLLRDKIRFLLSLQS